MALADIPRVPMVDSLMDDPNADEDLLPPDTRRVTRLLDSLVQKDGELSDSDDEGEGDRRDHASHRDWDAEMQDADADAEVAEEDVDKGKENEEDEPVIARASTGRIATGIMNPGTTKGAGPTAGGHLVVRQASQEPAVPEMDVDEPELSEVRS